MPLYPSTLRDLTTAGIAPDRVLPYFSQILDGIEAAHLQGVWHRDLKPENILHDPSSNTLVVSDFGIAHFAQEAMYTIVETHAGERLANFQYSAPEQRAKGAAVDQRADLFALGLILGEMFTGEVRQGTGFRKIGDVSPDHAYLDEIVDRMVRQSPADRPESIDEINKILMGRKNEFVSRQKLDSLKGTVVRSNAVVDPIVNDPVKTIGFDLHDNTLLVTLNHTVPPVWIRAFKSIGSYTFIQGSTPSDWDFGGNHAAVKLRPGVDENSVQMIVNHFKDYLDKANAAYRTQLQQAAILKEANERRELQEQIEREEKRQRILSRVKI